MAEEETKEKSSPSVKDQEAAAPVVDSDVQKPQPQGSDAEKSKDYNFAKLREKAEAAERESAELKKRVDELTKLVSTTTNPAKPVEEDELSKLDPHDIITVEQAMKVSERQAKKIVQEILEQKEKQSLPERTRQKFNDFDSVVTQDNIKKLEQEEPGLAQMCASAANPWESTYKILKRFYIPEPKVPSKGEEKLKANASVPASVHSVGPSKPLDNVNSWSEASKERLYKEMMEAAKQVQ